MKVPLVRHAWIFLYLTRDKYRIYTLIHTLISEVSVPRGNQSKVNTIISLRESPMEISMAFVCLLREIDGAQESHVLPVISAGSLSER